MLLVAMSAIKLSMLFLNDPSSMTIESVMGVMSGVSMEKFSTAASGLGLVYTMIGILLSFSVCDDFFTGFAKNLFTVHANKRDCMLSKICSMMIASGIMMLVSTAEAVGCCMISGIAVGNLSGIIGFLIENDTLTLITMAKDHDGNLYYRAGSEQLWFLVVEAGYMQAAPSEDGTLTAISTGTILKESSVRESIEAFWDCSEEHN